MDRAITLITIKKEHQPDISGILNDWVIDDVCRQTGLSRRELLATLDALECGQLIYREEADLH